MHRFHQLLFTGSIVVSCWLLMMAVHELGHVVGAILTGGQVERVILHPLSISRTDVSPNPHPGIVVWLGPILGCLLPLAISSTIPAQYGFILRLAKFFSSFCLIANGAYIGLGSFENIGDCQDMLRTGTPMWTMLLFGAITVTTGLFQWHRLGSSLSFLTNSSTASAQHAYFACAFAVAVFLIELVFV